MSLRESWRMSLLMFTRRSGRGLGHLPTGFFLETTLIVGGQHFARYFCRRVDDEPAQFALELAHGALMLERARLACLGQDLLRRNDRFLLLALGDYPGAGASFINHL